MPLFSLPGKYGIGSFSKEAREFVRFLKEAGQSYWQILPMGPTGYGDSPYQSFSTFAGNPYFIDLDLNVLGYIDPGITVNYIRDGKRVDKANLSLPDTLKNVLHCKNPRCITSTEQELPQVFKKIEGKNRQYRCIYCDTIAKNDEFE